MTADLDVAELVARAYGQRMVSWRSAKERVTAWLENQRRQLLDGQDESRLDLSCSRIKEKERTTDKLRQALATKDDVAVELVEDVEEVVRDLVGVKVLCKSPRDQRLILEALLDEKKLDAFELVDHKDYVTHPKSSGYRAAHVVLSVPVDGEAPVYAEIQVKTRLQDAWGELTHEDMYKPAGGALRPGRLHHSVASTMAALLAQVDALADELALELSEHGLAPDLAVGAVSATEEFESERTEGQRPQTSAVEVRVRRTGPRYALAVDAEGLQGLIPAFAVKELVGSHKMIDVDDFIAVGDLLDVDIFDDEKGTYFVPRGLPNDP